MIKSLYEPFIKWSEKGSIYIISDTHFYDEDREYMNYTVSEEEQFSFLKKITKNDTLIHLGDVGEGKLLERIKARKVLISGNHDTNKQKEYFDEVYNGALFISPKILLSHEPVLGLDFCFNLHGHDHSGAIIDDIHLNLAQNVYGYKPLSLANFIKSGKLKNIKDIHRKTIDKAIERKLVNEVNKYE